MSRKVTIVEYHYVRDLKNSRYPAIKGLDVALFKGQLDYIQRKYHVIRMEDLLDAVQSGKRLPKNPLLLTFDDGYRDHFEFAFPILKKRGIQGSFFPPASIFAGQRVQDVNKIHFILASVGDDQKVIQDILSLLNTYREQYRLRDNPYYFAAFCRSGLFDTKEVVFIKQLLQKALPERLRAVIVDFLFKKYVTVDEVSFCRELYLSFDEVRHMREEGMYIGGHGYHHCWLDTLSPKKQESEVILMLQFLKRLGCGGAGWVMCYPFGACNHSLIGIVKKHGCALGLIEGERIADLEKDDVFSLPRLDTNYMPRTHS